MTVSKRNETTTRALTGVVFVAVVMGAVAWSAWSNALLWAVVAVLAWAEWFKAPKGPPTSWPNPCFSLPSACLAALVWMGRPHLTTLGQSWVSVDDLGQRHRGVRGGQAIWKAQALAAVSPGKSWEGTLGGVAARQVAWAALGLEWLWLGGLMGALSTAGDLTQSAWKRRRNVGLGQLAARTWRHHGQV